MSHHNDNRISDILHKFQQETHFEQELEKIQKIGASASTDRLCKNKNTKDQEREELEDILDDSDEEKSIKNMNTFEIKAMEVGSGIRGFAKNFSEHDFLHKELLKKNKNLMINPSGVNRIQLIVRIRPFLVTEQIKESLKVVNENGIRLFKEFNQVHFKFDTILMPKDPQDTVFTKVSSIVQSFLMGLNGTIFAYGQTGAGKTYSIIGGEQKASEIALSPKIGILPRTLDFIFSKVHQERPNFKSIRLSISFYEIYNEKIYDLLNQNQPRKSQRQNSHSQRRSLSRGQTQQQTKDCARQCKNLDIREDKEGQFSIPELKRVEVNNIQEAYEYLDKGLLQRATSSTSLNNQSSRSHSIFQIYLEKENFEGVVMRSKIRIVDLAGSEKYTIKKDLPIHEKNAKVQELTSINSSLSALGQCISALSDPGRKHIPYRNSKLTKVLKDSLDESSNVALIICISPSVDSYKETLSTLQFADRAKKAILDGRNFSDSKLLQDVQHNTDSLSNIFKAYQEEKAIRRGLEMYMKENNKFEVFEELEKLKKQNQELQDKVKLLELKKTGEGVDVKKKDKKLKSCLKKEIFTQNENMININIVRNNNNDDDEDDESNKKTVRFAEKLDNDQSLDSDDRERIEHNLKYNDDTIFENISIFQDVNNSGIVFRPRIKDRKDVHPSKLKKPLIVDDDDEEEKEGENNPQPSTLISKIEDSSIKQFWGVEKQQVQTKKQEYDLDQDSGVSPIQKRKPNNSSQDMSKDLIDLDNDNVLKNLDEMNAANISQIISVGDKTMGTDKTKNKEKKGKQVSLFQNEKKEECMFNQQDTIEPEESSAKGYHVCNDTEQFFEADFDENDDDQQNLIIDGEKDQILSDSIITLDAVIDNDVVQNSKIQNNSNDHQNTLFLDSQSMIIDNENTLKDQNMSLMQSLEASSILQQRDTNQVPNNQQNQPNHCFFSVGQIAQNNNFFNGAVSNAPSSNHNTDVLTYSLTNTFSTIESLHDELTAIRNGLELSQKQGTNIIKTIHKYAREIEENKVTDFYHKNEESKYDQEEDVRSNDGLTHFDEDNFEGGEVNLNFIKDIKGFYSKIHREISQLKTILIDSAKPQQSPTSLRKHLISEQVPYKDSLQSPYLPINNAVSDSVSCLSIDGIERTQEIILELRKEMEIILNINQPHSLGKHKNRKNEKHKAKKSLKVLDLLEALQASLANAMTPAKSEHYNDNKNSNSNLFTQAKRNDDLNNINYEQSAKTSPIKHKQGFQDANQNKVVSPFEQLPSENSNKLMSKVNHNAQPNNLQQIIDSKNIIKYEEVASNKNSPSSSKNAQKSDRNNSIYPQSKQRTPEIFKSLAKLDESEIAGNNSIIERDLIFSSSQINQNQHVNQPTNQVNYYSGQAQTPTVSHHQNVSDNQDLQITLRSYNPPHNHEVQQTSNENSNMSQFYKRKSLKGDLLSGMQQHHTDNTLTLIFDSDDEQLEDDQIEEPEIKEIEEDEDDQNESSLMFNDQDESKIDGASSGGNGSRIINNLINSNSFQADTSLLFFANNIIINGSGEVNSSGGSNNTLVKIKSKSVHNNSGEEVTPDRKYMKQIIGDKKANNKFLLPQSHKQDGFGFYPPSILSVPHHIQIMNAKSFKEQTQLPFLIEEEHSQIDEQRSMSSITFENINKSTSKNSVQKYWNQFFNNNNPNFTQQNINSNLPKNSKGSLTNVAALAQDLQSNAKVTRNHNQQTASRSAYQSNSYKDDMN